MYHCGIQVQLFFNVNFTLPYDYLLYRFIFFFVINTAPVIMSSESKVEVITDSINIKKIIGYSYITGYALGTILGCLTASPQNIRNNVTKYNQYLGNVFATSSTVICTAYYIQNKFKK